MHECIILSDLSTLADKNCLGDGINCWKAIPYEAENFSGIMLGHGRGEKIVPLKINLNQSGKYRIWIGIYGGPFSLYRLRARLSNDQYDRIIAPPLHTDVLTEPMLYEVCYKDADLTGQHLIIKNYPDPNRYSAAIAYIRLESIVDFKSQNQPKSQINCPMVSTEDGHGIFSLFPHEQPEDLLVPWEYLPDDTCMKTLLWGIGNGDVCNYPTQVGNFPDIGQDRCLRHHDDIYFRNLRIWKKNGWNSLAVVRDYTRKRGWEFYPYIRMESFSSHFPLEYIKSDFFVDNPQYHCFDKAGCRVMRLSYAYPQVQQHMLDLIAELSAYDSDGISLCFIRGVPIVLYEEIMVNGFKSEYGVDPRLLDELDKRWLDYQCKVLTGFIERVKTILKPSQRLLVMVPAHEADCVRWGLDIADWVERNLVDDIYITGQRFCDQDVHVDAPENIDMEFFNHLKGRDKIRLIPMLYPWNMFRNDYDQWKKVMQSYIGNGADSYAVWDALQDRKIFGLTCNLGSNRPKDEVQPCEPEIRKQKMLTLNGFRFDRYHHYEII